MNIRPARAGDIPSLLALQAESPTAAQWSELRYREIFTSPGVNRIALIAEDDCIRGFLVARAILEEWEIENVVVATSSRRTGLGSQLLHQFLALARSAAAQAVFLEVRESNRPARALYEKFHFLLCGRRPNYYSDPGEDALVFRLSFS